MEADFKELKNGVIKARKTELENPTKGDVVQYKGGVYLFQKETELYAYYKKVTEDLDKDPKIPLFISGDVRVRGSAQVDLSIPAVEPSKTHACDTSCCGKHNKYVLLTLIVLGIFAAVLSCG